MHTRIFSGPDLYSHQDIYFLIILLIQYFTRKGIARRCCQSAPELGNFSQRNTFLNCRVLSAGGCFGEMQLFCQIFTQANQRAWFCSKVFILN